MGFQGQVTTQAGIPIGRLKEVYIATKGFPKVNGTGSFESMKLPLRADKGGILTYTTIKQIDVATATETLWYQVKGSVKCIYTGQDLVQNLRLLSQDACQVWCADLNSNFYSFTAPAGTFGTPTATNWCGVGYKFHVAQMKERTVTVTFETILSSAEFALLMSQATAYAGITASGGTTNNLVSIATPGHAYRPGFKSITVNAVVVGELDDNTEYTSESVPIVGNKGLVYSRFCKETIKLSSLQMNPTNLQGVTAWDAVAGTYPVVLNDYGDVATTFTTGLKPDLNATHGDDTGKMEIILTAEYPYDFTNAITVTGTGVATATSFTQLGY